MSVRIIGTSREAKITSSGSLVVTNYNSSNNESPSRYTYDVSTPAFLPGVTPKDVIFLTGAESKIIRVTRVRLTTTQNTNGINSWYLLKRTTPNTGGIFNRVLPISRNDDQPDASAIFGYYTNDYTDDGVLVGLIRSIKLRSPSPTGLISIFEQGALWDCDDFQSFPIVLRGPFESLALNFDGANRPNGMSIQANFTWTEEII